MAGTRTAPAFTAAANGRVITLQLMDASGDLYAESMRVPVAATAASIEAWAGFYAAACQASLYGILDTQARVGDADPDNAETDQRNSVKDGINLSFRNLTTWVTLPMRIVAPVPEALQGNQDIPLLSSDELTNVITSILTIQSGFDFQRAQFTERRERQNNPVIK